VYAARAVSSVTRCSGRLVYLMRVERAFTFVEYHNDDDLRRRLDNIYKPRGVGGYAQRRNDFHGPHNIRKDLSADRVLASQTFVYFGEKAPAVPAAFTEFVPRARGHRVFGNALGEPEDSETSAMIRSFVRWAFSHGSGQMGHPFDKPRKHSGCSP